MCESSDERSVSSTVTTMNRRRPPRASSLWCRDNSTPRITDPASCPSDVESDILHSWLRGDRDGQQRAWWARTSSVIRALWLTVSRWSGSLSTVLFQPTSIPQSTSVHLPWPRLIDRTCVLRPVESCWFCASGLQWVSEVSLSVDRPSGTVCRLHYEHQNCHRTPSYVHWTRTGSWLYGIIETVLHDSSAEYKYTDLLTYFTMTGYVLSEGETVEWQCRPISVSDTLLV